MTTRPLPFDAGGPRRPPASARPQGVVLVDGNSIIVKFSKVDRAFVAAIKTVEGARYDPNLYQWTVHVAHVRQVRQLAEMHGWVLSPRFMQLPDVGVDDVPIVLSASGEQLVVDSPWRADVWKVLSDNECHYSRLERRWYLPYERALDAVLDLQSKVKVVWHGDENDIMARIRTGVEMLQLSRSLVPSPGFVLTDRVARQPYDFQLAGIEYAVRARRSFCWGHVGSGKTTIALAAMEQAEAFPLVVVCPLSIKLNWAREAAAVLPHRAVFVAGGSLGGKRGEKFLRAIRLHNHERQNSLGHLDDRRPRPDVPAILDETSVDAQPARLSRPVKPSPGQEPVDQGAIGAVHDDPEVVGFGVADDRAFAVDDPGHVSPVSDGGSGHVDRTARSVLGRNDQSTIAESSLEGERRDAEFARGVLPLGAFNQCPVCLKYGIFGEFAKFAHADIITINYDSLGDPQRAGSWASTLREVGLRGLAFDEAHRISNGRTLRARGVTALSLSMPMDAMRMALTGTPVRNRRDELASQLTAIGREGEFGEKKDLRTDERLARRLRTVCAWRPDPTAVLRAVGALDENGEFKPIEQPVIVDGDPAVMQEYRRAEADIMEYLRGKVAEAGGEMEALERIAASGAEQLMIVNVLNRLAGKAKMAFAREWVEDFCEGDDQLLVFAENRDVMDVVAGDYPQINGDVKDHDRLRLCDEFQAGRVKCMVLQVVAAGEGLTLTNAEHVMFAQIPWTAAAMDQCAARAEFRMSAPHPVLRHVLVLKDSIDEDKWSIVQAKRAEGASVTDSDESAVESDMKQEVIARLLKRALGRKREA